MVIGPGKNGITAHVILTDDEALPANLNSERIVVYRRGKTTDMELRVVKPLGKLADPELLRNPSKPVCNFESGPDPLHEHADGTWWFYEETWAMENGPFPTYDDAYNALAEYCIGLQRVKEFLTNPESDGIVNEESENEAPEINSDPEVGSSSS